MRGTLLAVALQDGRVVFMLPWQGAVVAGTTDEPCSVTPRPAASAKEVDFILEALQDYLGFQASRGHMGRAPRGGGGMPATMRAACFVVSWATTVVVVVVVVVVETHANAGPRMPVQVASAYALPEGIQRLLPTPSAVLVCLLLGHMRTDFAGHWLDVYIYTGCAVCTRSWPWPMRCLGLCALAAGAAERRAQRVERHPPIGSRPARQGHAERCEGSWWVCKHSGMRALRLWARRQPRAKRTLS